MGGVVPIEGPTNQKLTNGAIVVDEQSFIKEKPSSMVIKRWLAC